MALEPIERIRKRNQIEKQDSDTAYWLSLMSSGEQLVKLVACILVSLVKDDPDKHAYAIKYRLIRASGIGDWAEGIDQILTSRASLFMYEEARPIVLDLTQKFKDPEWQYESLSLLNRSMELANVQTDKIPVKVNLIQWFKMFSNFRNKTKGHGAVPIELFSDICIPLAESIRLIEDNLSIFKLEFAYLHQRLSGHYKVVKISDKGDSFLKLNGKDHSHLTSGVYVYLNKPILIDLLKSTQDLSDFFFPNGHFRNSEYESISYITGQLKHIEGAGFIMPPGELPASETEGATGLNVIGNCFTNLPSHEAIYINRSELENEVLEILKNDRHPVVTLVGRGGIGKTSLALNILRRLCNVNRFDVILWFSARDIDLLEEGAKAVRPQVLDRSGISKLYCDLIYENLEIDTKNSRTLLERDLAHSENGRTLFVFDNFETLNDPVEVFKWLDSHIRNPNKVLITSRFRDFKADYPISVMGMTENEFNLLVKSVSELLKIEELPTKEYLNNLYVESGGHPYVAKILLGEIAKAGKAGAIKRIVAGKEELLTALFERTYDSISTAAKRVFLLLCNWRSVIPQIGIEAVLRQSLPEAVDVEDAIDELFQFSLIDKLISEKDSSVFITVPISAFSFGQNKLDISPDKPKVIEDTKTIMKFGVGQKVHVSHGIEYRINVFFINVAKEINLSRNYNLTLQQYDPIITYICRRVPSTWLLYATLLDENSQTDKAINSLENYVQSEEIEENKIKAWEMLVELLKRKKKYFNEAHWLNELCDSKLTPDKMVSSYARRFTEILKNLKTSEDQRERKIIITRMIKTMEKRFGQNPKEKFLDDFSNLAWFYIYNGDINKARSIIRSNLRIDPTHLYSMKVKEKFHW